jgi:uncharacterized DUF497 family protein
LSSPQFEWDSKKAALNVRRHRVTFEEAATVFNDLRCLREYDLEYSGSEDREIVIGFSERMRLLMVVVYEQEENVIRIISARRATREEGIRYFLES